jgi:hypothetical protein
MIVNTKQIFAILAVAMLLTACSGAKKLFNKNDDSVLQGQREEVLPPDQQTARDPAVTGDATAGDSATSLDPAQTPAPAKPATVAGKPAAPGDAAIGECDVDDPNDQDCLAPVDQEAVGTGQ